MTETEIFEALRNVAVAARVAAAFAADAESAARNKMDVKAMAEAAKAASDALYGAAHLANEAAGQASIHARKAVGG